MRNLPFQGSNRIWLELVALALDLTAWLQMLAFGDHTARRGEPKTLRLYLFSLPSRLTRHAPHTLVTVPPIRPGDRTGTRRARPAQSRLISTKPSLQPAKGPPPGPWNRRPARCTGQRFTPSCGPDDRRRATELNQARTSAT